MAALGSMQFPNIYPDPECRTLRAKLSELNDTPAENILVLLRHCFHCCSAISLPLSATLISPCPMCVRGVTELPGRESTGARVLMP